MPIELLIVLMVVGGILVGTGALKVPQLRKMPATPQSNTTTTAGAAPAPAAKATGYLSKVQGEMNPLTFIGVMALSVIFIIFMLIPGGIVAYFGTILMGILMFMILISVVILVTGWGSRLLWLVLLAGFVLLAYKAPETTANEVAKGANTIAKGGLESVAPNIVPDFIYMSPAEKTAAHKAEEDEALRLAKLAEIYAAGEAAATKAAEIATEKAQADSMTNADAVPCVRRYAKELNCITVTFGFNTKYDRESLKDHCIIYDPIDAIQRKDLKGNQNRFTGEAGLVGQFFDVPIGKWIIEGKEIKCGV